MGALSHLEPKKVFYYFEQICKIPHGSGNIGMISDYLAQFAKERGLFCIQDGYGNIIIIKEASEGYEQEPSMILQGHMDMVAVKKPGCTINMKTEGLKLAVAGDYIYAEDTSLGGDDGIAVAYAMALLDDGTIKHPRLEIIITVDEEVGMDGARSVDVSMLKSRRMLNVDSEDEGIFLTGCAGGAGVDLRLPLFFAEKKGLIYEVTIDGLIGGHSGVEIHKERANSNCLMGRLLWELSRKGDIGIESLSGGLADNAIPRETKAILVIEETEADLVEEIVTKLQKNLLDELAIKDPGVRISAVREGSGRRLCVSGKEARKLADYLFILPNGVQAMSADIKGLVETSLNLGIMNMSNEGLHVEISVRSSLEEVKYAVIGKLGAIAEMAGGSISIRGDYPGWKYRPQSPLRDKMVRIYEGMYGVPPKIEAVHAGLECGLFAGKIADLDCVAIGPDMKNIHTTEEALSISSAKRVWEFIVKLLREKDR